MEDIRTTHTIYDNDGIGEVQIADDVVAVIAGFAATEVDGVYGMNGNITKELISKLGMKNLSKGVKAVVSEDGVLVDISLNVKFGCAIREVSVNVQDRVKSAIETMTGLEVICVNIRIANIVNVEE